MPGTTRYSATFDRPYEEEEDEDLPAVPPLTRRSRSASWQATTANGRPYTPLGGFRHARSSSTDNGPQPSSSSTSPAHSTERIPTRTTGKVPVKTSHNPFQFVKVGTCPLYKKAEELLKKTQKVKQPEALKEEEEEWQSNLDSWKSRRRKMSQDVFRRQEEMKELLEMEEQQQPPTVQQKKVKTFSEMVKDGASRGRTASLCLFSNPFGFDAFAGKDEIKDDSETSCNDTHHSSESAESSNVNSEEEDNDVFQKAKATERSGLQNVNNNQRTRRTGAVHFLGNHNGVNNGVSLPTDDSSNCDFKVSDLTLNGETLSHKCDPCQSGAYNDSGLDSLSSSHRAGDIPDSGSDFSQDSGSSLDCDSPGITGIPTSGTELLEEFSSKDVHPPSEKISHKEQKADGMELCLKLSLSDSKSQQFGFTISGGKDKGSPVTVASVINGSVSDLVGLKTGDHILAINKEDISSLSHSAVISSLKQSADSRQLELLLWRPVSSANIKQEKSTLNGSSSTVAASESLSKGCVNEQTTYKESSNKTVSKAPKGTPVIESSVDNRVDNVDSVVSDKKIVPTKQKDVNCKASAPAKSQAQESSGSTVGVAKNNVKSASVAEDQHVRSIESENEMFVDDFSSAPVSSNSKIPVAEKSPKIMGKRMSKSAQEAKKNKPPVNDSSKRDECLKSAKERVAEDPKDSSLNVIYQSRSSVPNSEPNAKELVSADSEHSVPSSEAGETSRNESSQLPVQPSGKEKEPKFNEKLTFETSEILPVDKVAEQMEKLILQQLEEEERLKEKPGSTQTLTEGIAVTTPTNVVPDHELSGIDTPPRQVEPPKEKPPPPPTPPSSANKDSPLNRVNSTKRIKKEIQKRRSDFLGIEKSEEEEESVISPPPDLENILKLECEQERKVREILGTESLHQRELSFEEEEIARKEREIIESLETEERMRMAKHVKKDENASLPSSDSSFTQAEAERIRKLQEERVRMEEERFLKEEQRIRLEEERHLREREEQIRREEALKTGDLPSANTSIQDMSSAQSSGKTVAEQKDVYVHTPAGGSNVVMTGESPSKKEPFHVLSVPTITAGSHVETKDTNKKLSTTKKTKTENRKVKTKQNITSGSESKTPGKLGIMEPRSQVEHPSSSQSTNPENIPATAGKEITKLKSTEMSKSTESSQNGKLSKDTASEGEGTKSGLANEQITKASEVGKSPSENKQLPLQADNTKGNKKLTHELKSNDISPVQNIKQNKNMEESEKTTSVLKQEFEILHVSHLTSSVVEPEMQISKQKIPSETSQNPEIKEGTSLSDDNTVCKKCVPVNEIKILGNSSNAEVQAVHSVSRICAPARKSKGLDVSPDVEVNKNKKAALPSVVSKTKSVLEYKAESVTQDGKPENEVEEKLERSDITPNVEQTKVSDKLVDADTSCKNILAQKPEGLGTKENVQKKKSAPPQCSTNETTTAQQNLQLSSPPQNTDIKEHKMPQAEGAKTEKFIREQKPAGNVVRVRKKKKALPVKPVLSENSDVGPSCDESASECSKGPQLPVKVCKSENKAAVCVLSDKQEKGSSSSSVTKATDINSTHQNSKAALQSENNKLMEQKNNAATVISSGALSPPTKNADDKNLNNPKGESSTDVPAISSSATALTTNSENIASVSSISSSVSNGTSLSQTGDGENKGTVCMPSASGDQSIVSKEPTNNIVPTKPLKKKEVIRKERERLRQEQEALQREREEYRRQMMKEQELLKESQKPHAPDAPVSRVGAPPPLKPALPLPLTSLPHASQALKENIIYTSRSSPSNAGDGVVESHNSVAISQSSSVLSSAPSTAARPKVTQNDAWGSHKVPVVKKQPESSSESRYNQNHWLIHEAEMRRISEQKERQRAHPSGDPRCAPPFSPTQYHPMHMREENCCVNIPSVLQKPPMIPGAPSLVGKPPSYPLPTQVHSPEQQWSFHPAPASRKFPPPSNALSPVNEKIKQPAVFSRNMRADPPMQAPSKPSRVIPMDRQEQMLSVSGRKRCSHCGEELGRGAAMIIESLQLYYHIQCFRCCVCQAQLGNGSCGTDVRVRNNKLHCHNCYSNDEAGLKFSQV